MVRAAQAKAVYGTLRDALTSDRVPIRARLRLYQSGVLSVLTHGHESWSLTAAAASTLRGWNARCLAGMTGRSVAEECRQPTLDLVAWLRGRRLRWAGQVLRADPGRLDRRALLARAEALLGSAGGWYPAGFVLEDAPPHSSIEELLEVAGREETWRAAVERAERRK